MSLFIHILTWLPRFIHAVKITFWAARVAVFVTTSIKKAVAGEIKIEEVYNRLRNWVDQGGENFEQTLRNILGIIKNFDLPIDELYNDANTSEEKLSHVITYILSQPEIYRNAIYRKLAIELARKIIAENAGKDHQQRTSDLAILIERTYHKTKAK